MAKWVNQGVQFKMMKGYAYELTGEHSPSLAPNDDWELVLHEPSGDERMHCFRTIDGTLCAVFKDGNRYLAQCAAATMNEIEE